MSRGRLGPPLEEGNDAVFCPNCGTKNESTAKECVQCQTKLQSPAQAAKRFKGTVMMQRAPTPPGEEGDQEKPGTAAGSGAAKSPPKRPGAFKGTMVGVAPPDVSGTKPASRKPIPKHKGTMMGIAPPEMQKAIEEARAKADAADAAKAKAKAATSAGGEDPLGKTQAAGSGPSGPARPGGPIRSAGAPRPAGASQQAARPTGAATPGGATGGSSAQGSASANSKLKGTMVGVAPPNVEELRKQAAAAKAAKAAAAGPPRPATSADKPATPTAAADTKTTGTDAPTGPGKPSSKLKGTMIGVAPPDMQEAIAQASAARAAAEGDSSEDTEARQTPVGVGIAASERPDHGGGAPAEKGDADRDPPSDPVNPLGGTMVGASPFATQPMQQPSSAAQPGTTEDGATEEATAEAEDRGFAPRGGTMVQAVSPVAHLGSDSSSQPVGQAEAAGSFAPRGGTVMQPRSPVANLDAGAGQPPAGPAAPAPDSSVRLPTKKTSPVLYIVAAVLVVAVLAVAAFIVLGDSPDEAEEGADTTDEPIAPPAEE